MHLLLLLALSLAGCYAGTVEPMPNQAQAERMVWSALYGQDGPPPVVEWVEEGELGAGVQGLTLPWKVLCVRPRVIRYYPEGGDPYETYMQQSALAHELMHLVTFRRTGDLDVLHIRGDWELAREAEWALYDARL